MSKDNKNVYEPGNVYVTETLVVEPQNYTHNVAQARQSGLGVFGSLVKGGKGSGNQTQTVSQEICRVTFPITNEGNREYLENQGYLDKLRFSNTRLQVFKDLVADPDLEDRIAKFHQGKESILCQYKGRVLNAKDTEDIRAILANLNIGMVHKYQLVTNIVAPFPFKGSDYSERTQMYHRTMKSKQAFRRFSYDDIVDIVSKLQDDHVNEESKQTKNQDGSLAYEVVTVKGRNGNYYHRLATMNAEIYESRD